MILFCCSWGSFREHILNLSIQSGRAPTKRKACGTFPNLIDDKSLNEVVWNRISFIVCFVWKPYACWSTCTRKYICWSLSYNNICASILYFTQYYSRYWKPFIPKLNVLHYTKRSNYPHVIHFYYLRLSIKFQHFGGTHTLQ